MLIMILMSGSLQPLCSELTYSPLIAAIWNVLNASARTRLSIEREFNLSTLPSANGFSMFGSAKNDRSGYSVSMGGDFNGDGYADIIIGAYESDANGQKSGQSYLLFGTSDFTSTFTDPFSYSSLNEMNGFAINGNAAKDELGKAVSMSGDFNGDGLYDVAIGAPDADTNDNTNSGQSYLLFGTNETGIVFENPYNLSSLNGTNGFAMNGVASSDESGVSINIGGDFNGDGISDLVIGAQSAASNRRSSSGQSYVLFGTKEPLAVFGSTFNLSNLNGTNGFSINGVAGGDKSGSSVSMEGDFNGDGFADLLIGASRADPNERSNSGQSYILFGTNDTINVFGDSFNLSSLDGNNGIIISGIAEDDNSGASVSIKGDFNGDGFSDILIGAYQADPNGLNASGQSYLLFGTNQITEVFGNPFDLSSLNGANGFTINGVAELDRSGASVCVGEDFNGDGYSDLVIGVTGADPNKKSASGQSCVLFGRSRVNDYFSNPFNLSSLNGSNGFIINGVASGDNSGGSVSLGGDFNGDGVSDLLIGAALGDLAGRSNSGQSYLVILPPFCGPDTYTQPAPHEGLCLGACAQGWWPETARRECKPCDSGCLSCYGPTSSDCDECTEGYWSNSSTCISYDELYEMIELEEKSLLPRTILTNDCSSCSYAGECKFFEQYQEERCVCDENAVGPTCAYSVAEIEAVVEKKLSLKDLMLIVYNMEETSSQVISKLSANLDSITDSKIFSNTTLLQESIQTARMFVASTLDQNNAPEPLEQKAFTSLLDVATNSLDFLHENDCLLNSYTTEALYNQSLELIQDIGRSVIAHTITDSAGGTILENSYVAIYSNRMSLRELTSQKTSLSKQEQLPAFSLVYDVTLPQNPVNLDNELDVTSIIWKKNPFYCPNQPDYNSSIVVVKIYEKGTNTMHPATNDSELRVYYPPESEVICQPGCSKVSHLSSEPIECACQKIDQVHEEKQEEEELDREQEVEQEDNDKEKEEEEQDQGQEGKQQSLPGLEQSMIENSNNINDLEDFNVARSAVFWVVVIVLLLSCFCSLLLFKRSASRNITVSPECEEPQLQVKGITTILIVCTSKLFTSVNHNHYRLVTRYSHFCLLRTRSSEDKVVYGCSIVAW